MSTATETDTSPKILVLIPDVVATHVLGESTAELGKGDLSLLLTEDVNVSAPTSPTKASGRTPVLTLSVGKAAFPLFKTTVFGTLADDMRVYVFTPEIGGEVGGYVKITLPEGVQVVGSPFEKLQTKFEEVLIHHGLLKEGIEAVADEIGKSMRDDSVNIAQNVRESTASYLAENSPTTSPTKLPESIHSATSSSASGTGTLASTARRMSNAASNAAGQAGAWVAGHVIPTTTSATHTVNSLNNAHEYVADGYSAGSTEVGTALTDAAGQRVQNAYGADARAVLANSGASVGNVGTALGSAAVVTSGAGLATAGIKGAAGVQTKQQEIEDHDVTESRVDAEEEAWNDVSI